MQDDERGKSAGPYPILPQAREWQRGGDTLDKHAHNLPPHNVEPFFLQRVFLLSSSPQPEPAGSLTLPPGGALFAKDNDWEAPRFRAKRVPTRTKVNPISVLGY